MNGLNITVNIFIKHERMDCSSLTSNSPSWASLAVFYCKIRLLSEMNSPCSSLSLAACIGRCLAPICIGLV